MDCPHCGSQMDPDKVFCEKCGKERLLVPLYEPEVEERVEQSITNIINEFHGSNTEEDSSDIDNKSKLNNPSDSDINESDIEESIERKKHLKKQMLFFSLGIVVLLFGIIVFVLIFSKSTNNSFEYHYTRARESYDMQDYETALKEANICLEINSNSIEVYEIKFHIFKSEDQWDSALEMAKRLYELGQDDENISEFLIKDMINNKNFEELASFVELCPYEELKNSYVDYLVFTPTFSEKSGEYEDFINLIIECEGNGEIRYTIDGREPTEKDSLYDSPLQLNPGTYNISAVYINQYGVKGETVSAQYEISGDLDFNAVVYPEEGNYKLPEFIVVEPVNDSFDVYYTTDGSDPNEDSLKYTEPIPMPLGHSQYKFIAIDHKGRQTSIETYSYNSNPDLIYTLDQSSIILKQNLISRGEMANVDGEMLGSNEKKFLICNSAISVNNNIYYFYYECIGSSENNAVHDGKIYAFHAINGEIYNAKVDEKGQVTLSAF